MKPLLLAALTAFTMVPLSMAQAQQANSAKKIEVKIPVENPSERLTDAEVTAANSVFVGDAACRDDVHVTIRPDDANHGFFHVSALKKDYYMHPVISQSGAVRMEDQRAGAMWLQLGSRSMLLDQKLGKRIAQECMLPSSKEIIEARASKTDPKTILEQKAN